MKNAKNGWYLYRRYIRIRNDLYQKNEKCVKLDDSNKWEL